VNPRPPWSRALGKSEGEGEGEGGGQQREDFYLEVARLLQRGPTFALGSARLVRARCFGERERGHLRSESRGCHCPSRGVPRDSAPDDQHPRARTTTESSAMTTSACSEERCVRRSRGRHKGESISTLIFSHERRTDQEILRYPVPSREGAVGGSVESHEEAQRRARRRRGTKSKRPVEPSFGRFEEVERDRTGFPELFGTRDSRAQREQVELKRTDPSRRMRSARHEDARSISVDERRVRSVRRVRQLGVE